MNSVLRVIVGSLLLLIPVIAVNAVKETSLGPLLTTPAARQKGASGAKVTIVKYSDFQCPSCAKMAPVAHKLLDYYPGKVRLFYKFYPLTKIHANAMPAARAANCAADQNKFWAYHDQLFATQAQWAPLADATTSFTAIAVANGLDLQRFQSCVADVARVATINADTAEAQRRQVTATPTFFVNDTRLVGAGFEAEGAQTIERELRK